MWYLKRFLTKPPTSNNVAAIPGGQQNASSVSATDLHLSPLQQPQYPNNVVIKNEPMSHMIEDDDDDEEKDNDEPSHQPPTFPPLKQLPETPPHVEATAGPVTVAIAKKTITPIIKQEPMG